MKPTEQLLRDALKPFADAYAPEAEALSMQTIEPEFQAALDRNSITPSTTVGDFRRAFEAYHAAPLPAQPQGQGAEICFDTDEFWNLLCNWADARTSGEVRSAREESAQDAILAYLNSATPPSQAPEPAQQEAVPSEREAVAYAVMAINARGKHYIANVKKIRPEWTTDDDGQGEYWSGNELLYRAAIASPVVSDSEILRIFEEEMFAPDQQGTLTEYPKSGEVILKAFHRARALARTAPVVAEWISVEDRLPKEGQTVLAFWLPQNPRKIHGGCYATTTYARADNWHDPEDDEDTFATPTFWTRLPASPSAEQGEGT